MLYLIKGEEPLLIQEAIDNIMAKEKGAQKKVFDITDNASLESALLETKSRSLFDERTIYFLKANKTLKKIPDNAKVITVYPIQLKQFPEWIENRFKKAGFILTSVTKKLLCDHFEGNILAADQCLQKLKLLYEPQTLTEAQILDVLSPSARYNVFDLMNNLRDVNKIPVILERLQEEGVEPAIVLWGLARECRQQKKEHALPLLMESDQIIKGIKAGNVWETLLRAALLISGRSLA